MSWFRKTGWFAGGTRSTGKSKRKSRAKAAVRGRSLRLEPLEKRLLLAITVIDPADGLRLMNSKVLGEWNTPGSYDRWTISNAASSSVAGGNLTVTSQTGANPLQISLTNIASGPFLDYGYFDYLQVRMQVPANFNQPLTFSFGTSTNTGFSSARQFTVPANQVAADGQFHVYRLDLGLTVWWKDTLHDLRLQPLGSTGAGQTAVIDYVEVGDLPGDVLTVSTASLGVPSAVNMANATCVQSKHYAFWYDSVDPGANPGGQTDWSTMADNTLHMLEECYQVYTKVQGYKEPFYWAGDGIRHKVNCTCWFSGYWMAGTYVNFDTTGLQDQGPGNPVPHEYGHFVDGQQGGFINGGDWESHANWHRESWIEWFSPYFAVQYGTQYQSSMSLLPLEYSNWRQDTPRLIYADYRVFAAMQNYDPGLEAQMWQLGPQNMTVWDKLALILPSSENVEDVAAAAESRWPMLDFSVMDGNGGTASMGSLMRADLWDNATDQANYLYLTTTTLVPEADNPGWYTVPTERAPEKYAFDWSWITPTSPTVTVNLQGINTIDPAQDWRWCLEEVDSNYNVTYSAVWAPGTRSYTMNNINDRLILFVMATPSNTAEDLSSLYNAKPNDKNIDRLNYPYQVQITGAVPATGAAQQIAYAKSSSGGYHKNPDGSTGGWVDSTATVASKAYVGPNARVLGSAKVLGSAQVLDDAVVSGNAIVQGSAIVSGYAVVRDSATVEGNAVVRDHATVASYSLVEGSAQIEDYAFLTDNATYTDSTIVRGDAYPVAGGTYSGTTILDYDYSFNWSETTGVHQGHFPWGMGDFQHYFDQTQVTPANLIASYSCSEPSGDLLWDEFGCEQASLRGSPSLVEDQNFQTDVLQFNGSSQWVDLDSNLADLNAATYAMWADPTSSTANQTLLYFGGSTGNYLELTARDANGYAHLTMSVGGVVKQLVSTTAVPLNQWTNIALSFGSGTATFYINGAAAGSAAISYVPRSVLGPNDLVSAQGFYLGRDASGNYFTGRMDDIRFYNAALTQAQVQNEMQRSGALIGLFYNNSPMTFDGSTTKAESGVHNGLVRTLMATINPVASPNEGGFYQPILDSNYEYGSNQTTTFQGSGLGLNNGYFFVLLDGYGMWNTGVQVQLNSWQTVAVTFDGSVAKFYVYNTGTSTWVKQGTLNYTADPNNLAGKNYRIGYGLANGNPGNTTYGTQTFFNGQIQNVKIYDRVVIVDPGTYSWDMGTGSGYQGGNGTWDATTANWSNGNGTSPTTWPGGTSSTAAFDTDTSASSWTVTVSGNPKPAAINFGDESGLASDIYTLSGGTLSVGSGGISAYVSGKVNSALALTVPQTWQSAVGQTLSVGGSINTGGNALTVNPGVYLPFLWNYGNVTDGGPTSGTMVFSGGVSGGGSLTMNGAGTLNMTAASTYNGGTTLNNGTTVLTNTSGSATGSGAITVASTATFQIGNGGATGSAGSDAVTNNGQLDFDRSDSYTESGAIGGSGTLTQMGSGSLTLGAPNTYTGSTYIAAGGLVVGNALALQDSTVNYTTTGTTFSFASGVTSATLGGLQGSINLSLQNASSAAAALSVGNNNQSTTYTGQLTGSGSLRKTGSGTFTVSAANTYSGGTTVVGGTLLVNNTTGSGLGTGPVNVASGGMLAGGGTISGTVTVASGGAIAPSPGTVGALTVGGLQLASGSTIDLEFGSSGNDTVVTGSAGLTINGGGVNLYQVGSTTAFAAMGTYQIFTHSGVIGGSGASSLSVLNKVPGCRYAFNDTGTAVTLTISQGPLWSGASGGVWSNTANWSGVSFLPGESLIYAVAGNAGGTSVNDQTNPSYPSAVFNQGAAAFALSGNAVTLTGDTNGNLVQNLSASAQTLALPITLGAAGALNAAGGPIVLGSAGSIATSAGKGLVIKGTGSVTLNGAVSGSGGVTESAGAGTLNLNNANALGSGTFTVNGGTIDNTSGAPVAIASNNAQRWNGNFTFGGSNNLNLGNGGVNMAAATTVTTNAGTLTVGGNIANASSNPLTKGGVGTLVLQNGSMTLAPNLFEFIYNGAVVLNNYSVNWTNDTAWEHVLYGPQSTTSLTLQNGSTFLGNNVLLADDANGGTLNIYDTSHFQTASGWDLEITRRGNATVNQDGGTVEVGGNLDYNNFWGSGSNCTGVYNLDAGTLLLHNGIAVGPYTTSTFNFGGGTLQFSNSQTVGGLNTMAIYASGNALGNSTATGGAIINTNGNYVTLTQALTNGNGGTDGGLTKLGAGTLELDATDSYTGPTTVSAGTLLVNNTSGSGTGTGAVTDNATLGGTGTIGGTLNVGNSGTLTPGTKGGIGTMSVNGTTTLAGTTVMDINKSGSTLSGSLLKDNSTLTYGGTITVTLLSGSSALVAGDAFTLFTATAYAGHFTAFNLPTLSSGLQWNLSNLGVNGKISIIASNNPQVAVPAAATLAANGKTASLSVLGNDNGGESTLKYTWSYAGPTGVTYSASGSNAAKNTTATFTQTGSYTFTVTITNSGGYTNTSSVTLTVSQIATTITIAPPLSNITVSGTQQFAAVALDQFGAPLAAQPAWTWSASGGGYAGTISASGLYTPSYASGTATVNVAGGSLGNTATVIVNGQAQWNSALDSSWGGGNWQDSISGLALVAPGVRSGSLGDTVLFAGTNVPTVQLNGATPTLAGITFNSAATSYTITQGTGGSLTLQGNSGVSVSVLAGSHMIDAPIHLASATTFGQATACTLTISGPIDGSGSLIQAGPGTLVLSGNSNSCKGGIVVTAGTLIVANPSAVADGTNLTVGAGAAQIFNSSLSSPAVASGAAVPAGPRTATVMSHGAKKSAIARSATATVTANPSVPAGTSSAEDCSTLRRSASIPPPRSALCQIISPPLSKTSRIDGVAVRRADSSRQIIGSPSAKQVVEVLGCLQQSANDANDTDMVLSKGRKIMVLDAVFAEYAK